MADEKEPGMGAGAEALLFVAAIGALITLWWFTGGPSRADLRGIFLKPPPPVNSGDAYGPQLNATQSDSYDYRSASSSQFEYNNTYQY